MDFISNHGSDAKKCQQAFFSAVAVEGIGERNLVGHDHDHMHVMVAIAYTG
jgi:hypothetical protein